MVTGCFDNTGKKRLGHGIVVGVAVADEQDADGLHALDEVLGVGGRSGGDSGVVSSPVAGGMMTIHGYAGIAVFNPYRSFIMKIKE